MIKVIKYIVFIIFIIAMVAFLNLLFKKHFRLDESKKSVIYVEHILDETLYDQHSAGGWINMHGFRQDDGVYYLGLDYRWLGIRVQDVVIRFRSNNIYNNWVNKSRKSVGNIINDILDDPDFNGYKGSDIDTEYIFNWGTDVKSFDIHLSTDRYGEQK